ncbi:unnamed protein product [Phytophthora fragariaefolia]|uniref:Unnamed protein product n=1 Tax=Phytophthora fragariaefolia TaxID=1490495 RepID=A0A9W6TIZ5_9STRA|nr:unnamed protein product [Phytophthora fragariaefolia]
MLYDVVTAFLYGPLEEEVYMEIPAGYVGAGGAKSLYELKQAPKVSNDTLHRKLTNLDFTRIEKDRGLYACQVVGQINMLVTVYVDDLLLIGLGYLCASVAASMQENFQHENLGEVKYLRGIEVKSASDFLAGIGCAGTTGPLPHDSMPWGQRHLNLQARCKFTSQRKVMDRHHVGR